MKRASRRSRGLNRLGLTVLVLLPLANGACGGKASRTVPSAVDAAGASSSAAGGSSDRQGATAGASDAGSTSDAQGGSAGASVGGSPSASCLDSGAPESQSSCDFNGYAFDPGLGYCRFFPSVYCSQTRKRFDTLEACSAACDPPGVGDCRVAADCEVQGQSCCKCEPQDPRLLRAVSRTAADANDCGEIFCSCAPFYGEPERPYYGARCVNQQCELYDVRTTDLSLCNSDADCALREGLQCCQCASAGPWVAVNPQQFAVMSASFLDCAPGECPDCEHVYSGLLQAVCVEGRCRVTNKTF
jgi:hypothetical protein